MSYSPWLEGRTLAACATLFGVLLVCHEASAQTKVGRQWLTSGLSMTPTVVADATAPADGIPRTSVGGGLRLRLGFQHVVARTLVMAAEVELGQAYQRPSTLAPDGVSGASTHFAWQAGLIGRWVPAGEVEGPAFGIGLHTFRAAFPEAPVQALSGDVRFGWYLWQQENFVLAEIGYAVPFLEGVDAPSTFDSGGPDIADQNWTMHRFVLGFSYGF